MKLFSLASQIISDKLPVSVMVLSNNINIRLDITKHLLFDYNMLLFIILFQEPLVLFTYVRLYPIKLEVTG